jgi:hypothetical protein
MLMEPTAPVDREPSFEGHWLSVSNLAERCGVTKQAISQNLKRWTSLGSPVATRRAGRVLLINVAHYDLRKGELGNLGRELGERTKKGGTEETGSDPNYTREQARAKGYEADLKFIEREKQLGRLVEVEALQGAAVACGEALVKAIDQIVIHADDVATAVAKDGVIGARASLKVIARVLRARAAEEFQKLRAATADDEGRG